MKLSVADKIFIPIFAIMGVLLIYICIISGIQEHRYNTLQDLRPCPFCGSTDIQYNHIIDYFGDGSLMCDLTVVECNDCGAEILSSLEYGEPDARELWNRRK